MNPDIFIFDVGALERDEFVVRYPLPFSTLDLPDAERREYYADGPIEYSHSMTSQLGGQMAAGFSLTHLAEAPHHADATRRYMPGYIATRAVKPHGPASRACPASAGQVPAAVPAGSEVQDDGDRAIVHQADLHVGPEDPVSTRAPSSRRDETTAPTRGSATGPGAAACQVGRRPLRVSA